MPRLITGSSILAIIAALALALYWQHQRITAITTARDNAIAAYQSLADQQARNLAAEKKLTATELQIDTRREATIKRIQAAPASDDAKLAPVLKQALEDLGNE